MPQLYDDIKKHPAYKNLDRNETEAKLKGQPVGTFVIRDSKLNSEEKIKALEDPGVYFAFSYVDENNNIQHSTVYVRHMIDENTRELDESFSVVEEASNIVEDWTKFFNEFSELFKKPLVSQLYDEIKKHPAYYNNLDRNQTENKLKGQPVGTFVIRDSKLSSKQLEGDQGVYFAFSFVAEDKSIKHGTIYVPHMTGENTFDESFSLVEGADDNVVKDLAKFFHETSAIFKTPLVSKEAPKPTFNFDNSILQNILQVLSGTKETWSTPGSFNTTPVKPIPEIVSARYSLNEAKQILDNLKSQLLSLGFSDNANLINLIESKPGYRVWIDLGLFNKTLNQVNVINKVSAAVQEKRNEYQTELKQHSDDRYLNVKAGKHDSDDRYLNVKTNKKIMHDKETLETLITKSEQVLDKIHHVLTSEATLKKGMTR